MIKHLAKKKTSIIAKMILIILILYTSSVFLFGQDSGAVQTSGDDYILDSNSLECEDSADTDSIHTASVNYTPKSTNQPSEASVIRIPQKTAPDEDSTPELPVADLVSNPGTEKNLDCIEGVHTINGPKTIICRPISNIQDTEETTDTQKGHHVSSATMLVQNQLNSIYSYKGEKTAYLTFDDGPTPELTEAILDILKEEEVKATFFPIGSNAKRHPDTIKRQYEEGHGIGNHTYSHVFKHIYASSANYIDELILTEQILQSILGDDKEFKLTRFPGGSFGKKLAPFRQAVNEAGYLYIDWNSLNGDAETTKKQTSEQLLNRLKETVKDQRGLIVLMHDAPNKESTVEALPEIIQYLRAENYRFELLPGSR